MILAIGCEKDCKNKEFLVKFVYIALYNREYIVKEAEQSNNKKQITMTSKVVFFKSIMSDFHI